MLYTKPGSAGFTLVELVIVIVLLGILAFYAAPRFMDVLDFKRAGAYQELVSATRYANRLAVGSGCLVRISYRQDGYELTQPRDGCSGSQFYRIPDSHPVSADTIQSQDIIIGSGNTALPVNATFTALGRCRDCSGDLTLTVGGREMTIHAETGYVNATS